MDESTILVVIRRVITAVYARQWSRDADKVRRRWLGTLIAFSVAIRGILTGLPVARIDVYRVYLRSNEYTGTFLLNAIWYTGAGRRPRIPFGNKCLDEIEIGFFATNHVPDDLFVKLRGLKALGWRITCRFDFPLSRNDGRIFSKK